MKSPFDGSILIPPPHWTRIATIDMQTGGEPLRVVASGLPPIEGRTVLEKRRHFQTNYDYLRKGLLLEPRGHADMYGAIVTPSTDADLDIFFLHNDGYSTMCGHAIIAVTTLLVETGIVPRKLGRADGQDMQVSFNVPAGRIEARAKFVDGRARDVSFRSVPSFLYLRDRKVDVPGIGPVRFDIAFSGAFYALIKAPEGLELRPEHFDKIVDYGRRTKRTIMDTVSIAHPFEKDLSFLHGTIFYGHAVQSGHHSRNTCIFAEGQLDRSATGCGLGARAASHFAKGELSLNEAITVEGILGSTMTVKAISRSRFGSHDSVVPEVSGAAHLSGRSEFFFDPDDPYKNGFTFR